METTATRTFKFRKGIHFGNIDAENDNFLKTCFLDMGDIELLMETSEPKRIVLGRTGTGKTALIEEIRRRSSNVIRIDPEALSLQYLSNSTMLEYLRSIGIHLELFYKLLWRHIFAVELIKCHYKLEDDQQQKQFLSSIFSKIGSNKKKRKAIEYLVDWSESFWEKTEYRVKEITEKLENTVASEVGFDIKALRGGASDSSDFSVEKKSEILHKTQTAVNSIQIAELNDLLSLMSTDIFTDPQKSYYLLIDDLDKDWVDQTIVYDLIRALLDVIYDFSHSLKNVKIIVALRENILLRVLRSETRRSPQREKYESMYLRLYWTKEELTALLELRLKQIMTGTYTSSISPTVKDILPEKSKNRPDGMSYILERTFMRPRDLIHFLNICVQSSVGKTSFSWDVIRKAELQYSQSRVESLQYEWQENYYGLGAVFKLFKGAEPTLRIGEIDDSKLFQLLQEEMDEPRAKWLHRLLQQFVDQGEIAIAPIKIQLITVLYQVGLVGIKPTRQDAFRYSFRPLGEILLEELSVDTQIQIHPMFHRALGIAMRH